MRDPLELEKLVESSGRPRVLILGDLILDRYVSGDVTRISPEVDPGAHGEDRRGASRGAATSRNRRDGREVEIAGVIGDDGWDVRCASRKPRRRDRRVRRRRFATDDLKTRMMSGAHQILRVDNGRTAVAGAACEAPRAHSRAREEGARGRPVRLARAV
jgi:D-beta-D-heptose 7-phosphate kinase/D-beta-D-heptose 1-phosphate adenosyltransferase